MALGNKAAIPRRSTAPFTSSVAAGVVVPMPTPVALSKTFELATVDAPENNARFPEVPPVVVTAVAVVVVVLGVAWTASAGVAAFAAAWLEARTNAEAGRPPRVDASAAFKA